MPKFISESATVSLARFVNEFREYDTGAAAARATSKGANAQHPMLVKRLRAILEKDDWDPQIIVFKGYKGSFAPDTCDEVRNTLRKDIEHAVVVVGNMAIDLCCLRLGSEYLPYTYPMNQSFRYWDSHKDVSKFMKLSPQDVQHLMEKNKQFINDKFKNPDKEPEGFLDYEFKD